MILNCGSCGYAGYTEEVNTTCPACHSGAVEHPRMIDFEEYRPIWEMVFEQIKRSVAKHGEWLDYSTDQVFEAGAGEFDEYREAVVSAVVVGRHGQISELVDVIVTAMKGIRRLKQLHQMQD